MDSFAFIIHPISVKRDVQRKYPFLGRILTERQIEFFSQYFPPVYLSEIEGIASAATGRQVKGWFIACPFTPRQMLELPEARVYDKIVQTGRMAEKLGAQILGLGAFTSVVGDAGVSIADRLAVPVTTGDSYTIAIAVESIQRAAELMGISVGNASVAVVGATGAIGQVCAELLSEQTAHLTLIGRRVDALEELRARLQVGGRAEIAVATDMSPLAESDLILTVTSAVHAVIQPEHLRPGSVVCDVARPRDVSAMVAAARDDIFVIDGGMVDVPGPVDFHFNFGFPPGKAYACMAETMALALEGRFEDYTLGKQITRQRVDEISAIAKKHGFRLSGFRSFEKEVTLEQIEAVRRNARRAGRN
ncbi:MAG: shikimate 5-dehydrogenase [Chloroflexota bacterium]|nr:MAG: shikimate 5-dehydrogenase [Chloroflexota bacterium]